MRIVNLTEETRKEHFKGSVKKKPKQFRILCRYSREDRK